MKLFLKKLILFSLGLIGLLFSVQIIWFNTYSTPPPTVSKNLCFNTKAMFLKHHQLQSDVEILAIGSSMSLINLNSNSIKKHFKTDRFINTAAWGIGMLETYQLIEIYQKKYQPKTIIIASNIADFRKPSTNINYTAFEQYLTEGLSPFNHLRANNFAQAIAEAQHYDWYKDDSTHYTSLNFDASGGVNYHKEGFNIDSARWNGSGFKSDFMVGIQYVYLDSISRYCKEHSIKLIFAQTPIRNGLMLKLNQDEKQILNNHIDKVKSIVTAYKLAFINSNNRTWPDSLFVDISHLNKEGSLLFTDYLAQQLNVDHFKQLKFK
ncbi:MAG: hypothetical protein HRT71_14210 [Flavobacteriales bacterium]|nr:hypothetical protein [Flavobacteriales bacterium]